MIRTALAMILEGKDQSYQILTDVPIVVPIGVVHQVIRQVPDGTFLRVCGGPLEGFLWEKEEHFTGYVYGDYEPSVTRTMVEHVKPGMVVYDLGAHHGWHSFLAHKCGASVVVAFEGRPTNIDVIHRIADANAVPLVVVDRVVARTTGPIDFHMSTAESSWGRTIGPYPSWWDQTQARGETTITVPGVALDDWIETTHIVPDLLKIDIEGAELDALLGGARLFTERRPSLVLSVHGNPMLLGCVKQLQAYGYTPEDIHTVTEGDILWVQGK